jgi:hypothetical protein
VEARGSYSSQIMDAVLDEVRAGRDIGHCCVMGDRGGRGGGDNPARTLSWDLLERRLGLSGVGLGGFLMMLFLIGLLCGG